MCSVIALFFPAVLSVSIRQGIEANSEVQQNVINYAKYVIIINFLCACIFRYLFAYTESITQTIDGTISGFLYYIVIACVIASMVPCVDIIIEKFFQLTIKVHTKDEEKSE